MVDPNHSLWLSTSHLPALRLHMKLTKTSTKTDKSSSCQERLISISPNLIFRTTPFYFVTYCLFCNLIGLQYTLQREQLSIIPDPLSMTVWLRETTSDRDQVVYLREGEGKILRFSAGPGIFLAYRKRNTQLAVKQQCIYLQQLH